VTTQILIGQRAGRIIGRADRVNWMAAGLNITCHLVKKIIGKCIEGLLTNIEGLMKIKGGIVKTSEQLG
jgi:hypothetical protein